MAVHAVEGYGDAVCVIVQDGIAAAIERLIQYM